MPLSRCLTTSMELLGIKRDKGGGGGVKPYYVKLFSVHYTSAGVLDNKGMVTPAQSERPAPPSVRVNITETDKDNKTTTTATSKSQSAAKLRISRRIRAQHLVNSFVGIVVVALIIIIEYGFLPSTKLGYTCNDPQISHKYRGEVITPIILGLGSLILPLLALICTEVLIHDTFRRMNASKVWFYYKECATGCMLVLLVTELIKVLVGEHRPHFLDVCEPDTMRDCIPGSFVEDYSCTSTKYSGFIVKDSSRSFPSGHSSVSVFVGLFSAYVIQTRLPTAKTGRLLKPFLVAVCISWCLICSLTRITDRRHHWWDVVAGMVLGIMGAVYTLFLVHKKVKRIDDPPRISTSTTTLLDVKNKDATSVII